MCTTYLFLPQCFWKNLIYCPGFLGAVHCIYCWRPVGSSLFSIFFCQLLWRLHYSCFISLPTVLGHMAKLSTIITCSIPFSFFINVHCVWVSSWTRLVFSFVRRISSPIFHTCILGSCPLGYLSPSSSIQSSSITSPLLHISPWACHIPPQYPLL